MSDLAPPIRILLLADSHLGFDLPSRPRIQRRRRGYDFLANHERALAAARKLEVDLVVHGGDVFHRSRAAPSLVLQAFKPLVTLAESGIPVFVVPGNHERSRIPHPHLATHPNLHVFHEPETKVVLIRGQRVAVSGFPYVWNGVRKKFPAVLDEAKWRSEAADIRLLCLHHCVEGAKVGPSDFTFRNARDVIRCSDLPADFAAVFSGHIHRHQLLTEDLQGRRLPTPVLYPGSVERTAFAEMTEEKGFLLVEVEPDRSGGRLVRHEFCRLPTRPMVMKDLIPKPSSETSPANDTPASWTVADLDIQLKTTISSVPKDSVLRIRLHGKLPKAASSLVTAARMRRRSPPEMNTEVILNEEPSSRRNRRNKGPSRQKRPQPPIQLQMDLPRG